MYADPAPDDDAEQESETNYRKSRLRDREKKNWLALMCAEDRAQCEPPTLEDDCKRDVPEAQDEMAPTLEEIEAAVQCFGYLFGPQRNRWTNREWRATRILVVAAKLYLESQDPEKRFAEFFAP